MSDHPTTFNNGVGRTIGWEAMKDYSEALIIIQELRKKAQDAAAEKNWSLVCDIADTIIDTALRLKIYSIIQMEVFDE